MNSLDSKTFNKIINLSKEINNKMNQKGIAIPVKNDDGSISVGTYTIIKEDQFFSIKDYRNENVVNHINLPHTAIILANSLALGKFIDRSLLQKDQNYGYAVFDEKLHTKNFKKRNEEKSTLFEIKRIDASLKKEFYKRSILDRFEKLHKNI
jgi:hypothetical protein